MTLSKIKLFYNTPFNNMQNTLHFNSNEERDAYFNSKFDVHEFTSTFNYRNMKGVLRVTIDLVSDRSCFEQLMGVNYCQVQYIQSNRVEYLFVTDIQQLNDKVCELSLVPDVVMTYTQGNVLNTLNNVNVIRQHYTQTEYEQNLEQIRSNNDVLATSTMRVHAIKSELFTQLEYILTIGANLRKSFGTAEKPKFPSSSGSTHDGIYNPYDMYWFNDYESLKEVMDYLTGYPWIQQSIKNVTIIPSGFIKQESLNDHEPVNGGDLSVRKLGKQGVSNQKDFNAISLDYQSLMFTLGLNPINDKHLLRPNIVTAELTDYAGNRLPIDLSLIETNLEFDSFVTMGAKNEIKVYVKNYNARGNNVGQYIDNALTINNFDTIGFSVDSGELGKANSAYSRELSNSRQMSSRINTVLDNDASVKDRLFNAISLSGGLSIKSALSGFNNEYEHYRDQKAQFKQMDALPNAITEGHVGYAPLFKQDKFGVHLRLGRISQDELNNVKKYYNMFGYECNDYSTKLSDITSMSICNWVQFKGIWTLPNVDTGHMNMLRALFEAGVRLWHKESDMINNTVVNNVIIK
ncbi:major tail protein [Streptococcus phage C1]|uniref:Major tail protein n=1 Tax=Streptococcus phage C1 TaxID=2907838 RepID=Q7Y3F0_BPSC1|nr:tail protein [Streptococcus phage C1]AAP42311.1 major tail protein [Streptococcus phage C1]